MAGTVKGGRSYHSPRRAQQAAATKRAVLDAALRLFEDHGYAATTVGAVAAEAQVATKTVYLAFESKAGLLRAVWDLTLKGDVSDAPVAERPWYVEVLEERDPVRKLELLTSASCTVKVRIGALLRVIRDAAPGDPEIGALWALIQSDFHANQAAVVETLDRAGALAPGLDAARATDILWTLNHPDVWLLLVGQRGWTREQFESWFLETATAQLLPPRRRRGVR